jgi:hypothetical protein
MGKNKDFLLHLNLSSPYQGQKVVFTPLYVVWSLTSNFLESSLMLLQMEKVSNDKNRKRKQKFTSCCNDKCTYSLY